MSNTWFVLTGGPSSGKTTLLDIFEQRGHKTLPEAARLVIDEGLANGLTLEDIRKDEKKFQDDVLARKVIIEAALDPSQTTFLDRGMHDSLAYYTSLGWKPNLAMKKALQESHYQIVFLLEPLPIFETDYARTEDIAFTQKITELLHDAYSQYGMTPVRVPILPPEERVEFILRHAKLS